MKTKALDASHLLIILTARETRALGLMQGLSWSSLHCRLTIARIFAAACASTNFTLKRDQVAIRAMATADGETVLMFTAVSPAKAKKGEPRKIYRIKCSGPYVYELENAGDLLDVLEHLYHLNTLGGCQLLRYGNGYRLILSPYFAMKEKTEAFLKEYARLRGIGKTAAALSLEHGELLSRDAVNQVGGCL